MTGLQIIPTVVKLYSLGNVWLGIYSETWTTLIGRSGLRRRKAGTRTACWPTRQCAHMGWRFTHESTGWGWLTHSRWTRLQERSQIWGRPWGISRIPLHGEVERASRLRDGQRQWRCGNIPGISRRTGICLITHQWWEMKWERLLHSGSSRI